MTTNSKNYRWNFIEGNLNAEMIMVEVIQCRNENNTMLFKLHKYVGFL